MSILRSGQRLVQLTVACAAVVVGAPLPVSAQAWLPAEGEGYISTVYTNTFVDKHYLPTTRYDLGRIYSNVFLLDATYGMTDRVAVSVSLPLVISRYLGSEPHPSSDQDDGTWHSTFQDFRFNVRYNVVRGRLAITPFVGTAVPSNKYVYWAHSAAGRRLRELHAGVTAARVLDRITPGLFLQGRYSFAFPQRVVDGDVNVRPYRSNTDLELVYFVVPSLRVFALGAGQVTHSGIDIPRNAKEVFSEFQKKHHDQIGRENYLNIGLGAAVDINDSVALYGSLLKQVAGRNSHELSHVLSVGVTWSFRRKDPDVMLSKNDGRERRLIRCV
jgi:hypothetical protein